MISTEKECVCTSVDTTGGTSRKGTQLYRRMRYPTCYTEACSGTPTFWILRPVLESPLIPYVLSMPQVRIPVKSTDEEERRGPWIHRIISYVGVMHPTKVIYINIGRAQCSRAMSVTSVHSAQERARVCSLPRPRCLWWARLIQFHVWLGVSLFCRAQVKAISWFRMALAFHLNVVVIVLRKD